MSQNVFQWFNGVFSGGTPVSLDSIFQGRSECDVSHNAFYFVLALVAVGLLERLCVLDGDLGTSETELAHVRVCIWCGCHEVVTLAYLEGGTQDRWELYYVLRFYLW